MALLGQDPNERYKVRPRAANPQAERPRKSRDWTTDINDQEQERPRTTAAPVVAQIPTAKVPEKVMVPVPVPTPAPAAASPVSPTGDTGRYKINMAGATPPTPALAPAQVAPTTPSPMTASVTQPFYATPPVPGDTATAPTFGSTDAQQPQEIPAWLTELHNATAQKTADENAPVKKDKWWKSALKMLAYGAKDMPPARDWNEFAYGAGRALGSGGAGLVDRRLPGKIQKRYQIAADQDRVEQAQKTANIESTIQGRTDAAKVRNARLNRDLSKDEVAKVQNERKSVAADLRRLPYIDPSNPVHAKLLARAKASGIDVDPESFGKGKSRQRITVLDDDGVTKHILERDPQKGWVPISIEGKDAIAGLAEKRNPLTGEAYSSEQRRAFERQKFDFTKLEAGIHDNQRERSLALQAKGMDIRIAQGQAEVDAIDDALPDLETQLNTVDDEGIRTQIQRAITTLKERRGRAAGAAGVPGVKGKTYEFTEDDVRRRFKTSGGTFPGGEQGAVDAARKQGLIPPQ